MCLIFTPKPIHHKSKILMSHSGSLTKKARKPVYVCTQGIYIKKAEKSRFLYLYIEGIYMLLCGILMLLRGCLMSLVQLLLKDSTQY